MLNKFAEELKAARLSSGVTLMQIATKTRLDLKFLEEMEKGNFSFLPGLYVNAFIKEYVRMVGLDEKVTLKKFEAARKGKSYDENGETEEDIALKKTKQEKEEPKPAKAPVPVYNATYAPPPESASEASVKAQRKKLIIISSAAAVLIFVIIYFAFIKNNQNIVVAEKPYDEVQQSATERYEAQAPKQQAADSTAKTIASSDSLSLQIDATDTSWIKIMLDDSKVEEFTIFPHSKKNIRAMKNYKIVIGNAAAMRFSLNNKPLVFTGKNKEVKFVLIDSAGLSYLSTPPTFGNN